MFLSTLPDEALIAKDDAYRILHNNTITYPMSILPSRRVVATAITPLVRARRSTHSLHRFPLAYWLASLAFPGS